MDHNEISRTKHLCLVCGNGNVAVRRMSLGSGQRTETECPDCKAVGVVTNQPPWRGLELTEAEVRGLFTLAGVEILGLKKLKNGYWTRMEDEPHPWWFVKTARGWVEIGWRKRVLSIDWADTDIRKVVTADDVTKNETGVHAWTEEDALKYLKELFR